ncbi:MAG: APC family permease [Hyphomicrobiaceae bacterium]
MAETREAGTPAKVIGALDAVAFSVGIVVGIGIFRTPPLVAGNTGSEGWMIAAWLLGGLAMLTGALCYAELASARPHAGGEYHFLRAAYGHRVAVLFAWARGTVIQTGAIAAVGFVFGEYAHAVLALGPSGPAIWAVIAVTAVTAVNLAGTSPGKGVQIITAGVTVLLVAALILAALTVEGAPRSTASASAAPQGAGGSFGLAMVFVLLTYGGWNEIAYLSGEMRDVRKTMVRAALIASAVVTLLYVGINLAYLHVLGFDGLTASKAVGAEFMRRIAGESGAMALSLVVCFAALSTLNATVFTGARVYYALGNDIPLLRRLGVWSEAGDAPRNALLLQGVIALALVGFGSVARDGFSAMVDYTAPVFWLFLLLVAISLFVLRVREPDAPRPFSVPLYPITPLVFAAVCAYLLYASLNYTGLGALLGLGVLIAGLPLAFRRQPPVAHEAR